MPLMAEVYFQMPIFYKPMVDASLTASVWEIISMWNEYNTHGLQVPDSPAQGFLHCSVWMIGGGFGDDLQIV
jgi:hypothetical protein